MCSLSNVWKTLEFSQQDTFVKTLKQEQFEEPNQYRRYRADGLSRTALINSEREHPVGFVWAGFNCAKTGERAGMFKEARIKSWN